MNPIPADEPPPSNPAVGYTNAGRGRRAALVIFAASVSYRIWITYRADELPTPNNRSDEIAKSKNHEPPEPKPEQKEIKKPPSDPGSFLDDFNAKEPDGPKAAEAAVLSNAELEKHFQALLDANGQMEDLKRRAFEGALSDKDFEQTEALVKKLNEQINTKAALLETAVKAAKLARPEDPTPRWLTGELLLLIGGEPEEIAPHLQFAAAKGLPQPRLAGSIALNQLKANRFAEAHRSALAAIDQPSADRYVWNAFIRVGFSNNQFDEVAKRLDRAFPAGLPSWATRHRKSADELQALWQREEKLRLAEAKADDLPRVKLVIEHRRFAKDAAGKSLTTTENLGREEVVLELFENEAPNAVANFLDLVGRKFYDGTSFHHAIPADMAAGGDPNTKNDDPADDGKGGPGYVLPNEFTSPQARSHFRGSISMFLDKDEKRTTGSQFYLSLAPDPEMNGRCTVFGRVIQGQEAIDRITPGRTNRDLGEYGKLIPGDLLVRAEILRVRPHEYKVVKDRR